MNAKWLAVLCMTVTAGALALPPLLKTDRQVVTDPAQIVVTDQPEIEVVFVLDTTGSMGGLIAAAKEKIWSIATTMAAAEPAPQIKIGLVAYRDREDAYVTRLTPLSSDLDQVYAELMDLEANGGGDTPESVGAGLARAVDHAGWSQRDGVYRVIFLVGDAPPKQYQDEPSYTQVVTKAAGRGIIVNTVRCGDSPQTAAVWQQIAGLAQGDFFSVGQSGDALAIATPFDSELARLSAELDGTRLVYGDDAVKAEAAAKDAATSKLHSEASVAARARRATYNASASGRANAYGDHDLIEDIAAARVDLEEVVVTALPEALQAMAPEDRAEYVAERKAKRDELNKQIADLAKERESYLAERAAEVSEAETSLDYQLGATLMRQAKEKGLAFEDAASPKL